MRAGCGREGGEREIAHRGPSSSASGATTPRPGAQSELASAASRAATVRATRATRARSAPESGSRSTARGEQVVGFCRPAQADLPASSPRPCHCDSGADRLRALRRRASSSSRAGARDGHEQVEAVQQRARELVPIGREPRRRAGALGCRIAARSAGAQVHRRHQLEARREDKPAADTRDRDGAVLERLPQSLQRIPRELRQLVEEEHPAMSEARLAGLRVRAPADDRGDRRRMVRRPERRQVTSGRPGGAGRPRNGCA